MKKIFFVLAASLTTLHCIACSPPDYYDEAKGTCNCPDCNGFVPNLHTFPHSGHLKFYCSKNKTKKNENNNSVNDRKKE